ncbi:MAG: hypothetical protein ACPL6C_01425, partial [bacterium]
FNFGFVYKGKIESYDSVIVLSGRSKFDYEIPYSEIMVWIDLSTYQLLRVEGYEKGERIIFILTIDRFERLISYSIPTEYTLYLQAADKQGKIKTTLSALKAKLLEQEEREK